MNWLINLIREIGGLPNTFWGIIVLFSSMYIAVHYNRDVGFYFAGVGSTLLGINHLQNTTVTSSSNPPQVKVETNASDTPSTT